MHNGEGYWVSPYGEIVGFDVEGKTSKTNTHVKYVIAHAKKFGFTQERLRLFYERTRESFGDEGKARDKILFEALQRGWIRIRGRDRGGNFSIQVWDLTEQTKKHIIKFARSLCGKYGPFTNFNIEDMKALTYTTHFLQDLVSSEEL